jgi:septal ring factor EnvC (AmiA/AmiB activator)
MKKTIVSSPVLPIIILILTACFFNAAAASPHSLLNRRHTGHAKSGSKYSDILKRLDFYKEELAFLSSRIYRKENDIKDLKNKIKNAEGKIKKLKNKIKKDGLLIKGLTMRIFIIHKEYGSVRLLSFKDNTDSFIINYQLKTLLKKEEAKLSKLVKRKNKFLKLKKYLKKEKNSLIPAVKSINGTKRKLEYLIAVTFKYIKSVKIKYKQGRKGNKKRNKKNRLLKRKVIKLIHNLNDSSRKNDIKFTIY